MNILNVAVVGVGIYGINHVNAYLWNPNVNLVAVCDLNPDITAKVAETYGVATYNDVEQMLDAEQIDAVSIATPDAYHADPALMAIRHGKHVLVEKPLATTATDARAIIDEAKQRGVRLAVDYHKRWDPASIAIRDKLADDRTGLPLRGYMNMDDIIDVPFRWLTWSAHSSPVHFLGTHCYDLIRWYMNCEVTTVYAVGTKELLSSMGVDTYDSITALLTFENGCHWTVENSWILPSGFPKNDDGSTRIVCEHAYLRVDSQRRGVEIFDSKKGQTPNVSFMLQSNGRPQGFGIEPINDFVHCLLTDKPFVADGHDGLQAELIAEAVHRSLEACCAVTCDE